jgi:hypothetical protein
MTENADAMLTYDCRARTSWIRDYTRPELHAQEQDAQMSFEQFESLGGALSIFSECDVLDMRLPGNDDDIDELQAFLGATGDQRSEDSSTTGESTSSSFGLMEEPDIGINDGNGVQTSQDVARDQQTVSISRIDKSTLSKLVSIEWDIRRIAKNTEELKEKSAAIYSEFDDREWKKAEAVSDVIEDSIQGIFYTMAGTVENVVTGIMALTENCQNFRQIMDEAIDINNKLKVLANLEDEDSELFEHKDACLELMLQIFYFARDVDNALAEILKRVIKKSSSATAVSEIDAATMQLDSIFALTENDAKNDESSTWQDDVSLEWPADILPKWPCRGDIQTYIRLPEAVVEQLSAEQLIQLCLQVDSDAKIASHDAQVLVYACRIGNVRARADYICAGVFKKSEKPVGSHRFAYSVLSACVRKIMATMANIRENWHWIKPAKGGSFSKFKLQNDPVNTYAQLADEAYEILRGLAAEMTATEVHARPDLISQIKDFAETVMNVSERAKSRAHNCNKNLRLRVKRSLQRASERSQEQTHTD